MVTNFFELATTLKNLGAKWPSEKKVNFTPLYTVELAFFFSCILHFISGTFGTLGAQQTSLFGGNALGG